MSTPEQAESSSNDRLGSNNNNNANSRSFNSQLASSAPTSSSSFKSSNLKLNQNNQFHHQENVFESRPRPSTRGSSKAAANKSKNEPKPSNGAVAKVQVYRNGDSDNNNKAAIDGGPSTASKTEVNFSDGSSNRRSESMFCDPGGGRHEDNASHG